MSDRKYELTDITREVDGVVLRRIRALRNIPRHGVTAGDYGGWVEKEHNLGHRGDAWVDGHATVYGHACVHGDALVTGDAVVKDYAAVSGSASVADHAAVYGYATVDGEASVYRNAHVFGRAAVSGEAEILGSAKVYGNALVRGQATVFGKAEVCELASVAGLARVYGSSRIYGNASIREDTIIGGNAYVSSPDDYMTFRNTWSSGRRFVYTGSNKVWRVGCFCGTGRELIDKAYKDSQLSGKCYEAIVRAVEAIEAAKNEHGVPVSIPDMPERK